MVGNLPVAGTSNVDVVGSHVLTHQLRQLTLIKHLHTVVLAADATLSPPTSIIATTLHCLHFVWKKHRQEIRPSYRL